MICVCVYLDVCVCAPLCTPCSRCSCVLPAWWRDPGVEQRGRGVVKLHGRGKPPTNLQLEHLSALPGEDGGSSCSHLLCPTSWDLHMHCLKYTGQEKQAVYYKAQTLGLIPTADVMTHCSCSWFIRVYPDLLWYVLLGGQCERSLWTSRGRHCTWKVIRTENLSLNILDSLLSDI